MKNIIEDSRELYMSHCDRCFVIDQADRREFEIEEYWKEYWKEHYKNMYMKTKSAREKKAELHIQKYKIESRKFNIFMAELGQLRAQFEHHYKVYHDALNEYYTTKYLDMDMDVIAENLKDTPKESLIRMMTQLEDVKALMEKLVVTAL